MSQRVFDLTLGTIGLLLLAPLFVLVAVLIKIDSRGRVFFRQARVGKNGKSFRIFKFRTMVDNAHQLGPRLTQKGDPRVTRLGQLLRWLKIDEWPQLLNVLRGEMSIVGPRPEDPHFVRLYTDEQRAVLSVRPGILGLSQTFGRDELEKYPDGEIDTERYYIDHILPEKLATDLRYVRTRSLWGDIRLVVAGVRVTVLGALKWKFLHYNRRRIGLLLADTVLALLVYHVANVIKLGSPYGAYAERELPYLAVVTMLIVLVRPPLFVYYGLYQNLLRYLGINEFLAIAKAVTTGTAVIVALTFMLGFQGHSRLVFLIDWILLVLVLFTARVARQRWEESARRDKGRARVRSVVIAGADDTGLGLLSVMTDGPVRYRPVGFLDDDPGKKGVTIQGVPVLGRLSDLPLVVATRQVDLVVILFPRVAGESLAKLVELCRAEQIEYRCLPTLDRLLQGDVVLPEFDTLGIRELVSGETAVGVGPNGVAAGNGRERRPARKAKLIHRRPDRPVLVTGGAGYIGSHVVAKLLAQGRRVRVLDNFLYGDGALREFAGHPHLEIIEGDIRHLGTMAEAARGADSVIALAALVGDTACELDKQETMSTNLAATRVLAEVCQAVRVRRVVFASSCSVYGANGELILNEGSWLNPTSLYARTRIGSEELLLRRKHRVSVTILRLATVFGLSRRMRLDLVVNTFTAHAYFRKRISVFGGKQYRPNVHVQDAAEAFLLAAAADGRASGEVFNVGDSGQNYPIVDIAHLVGEAVPDATLDIQEAAHDQRDYRVSFDKIRHVLGFRARRTIEVGVAEMVDAFRRGEVREPTAEVYSNFLHLKRHGFRRGGRSERLALPAGA